MQPAFADRDAVGGVVVDHLEADPGRHRQAVQIQRDVAVDVAEALVAGMKAGDVLIEMTSSYPPSTLKAFAGSCAMGALA